MKLVKFVKNQPFNCRENCLAYYFTRQMTLKDSFFLFLGKDGAKRGADFSMDYSHVINRLEDASERSDRKSFRQSQLYHQGNAAFVLFILSFIFQQRTHAGNWRALVLVSVHFEILTAAPRTFKVPRTALKHWVLLTPTCL